MANIGEWIVSVIAEFDPDKIVKKMGKAGKKSGKEFSKAFDKIIVTSIGSAVGNTLSNIITSSVSGAWNSVEKKVKDTQNRLNESGNKAQSTFQTSQETGVNSGILEALGSMSTAQGGSQDAVNSVFQQIKDARMRGESKVGGKDTLDIFNNMLDRVFAEQDLERRSMLIKDFGLEGMSNILYNGNKDSFREQLANSNRSGRVDPNSGAVQDRNGIIGQRATSHQNQERANNRIAQLQEEKIWSQEGGIRNSQNFDNNIQTTSLENTLKNFDKLLEAYKKQVEIETGLNKAATDFISWVMNLSPSNTQRTTGTDAMLLNMGINPDIYYGKKTK